MWRIDLILKRSEPPEASIDLYSCNSRVMLSMAFVIEAKSSLV